MEPLSNGHFIPKNHASNFFKTTSENRIWNVLVRRILAGKSATVPGGTMQPSKTGIVISTVVSFCLLFQIHVAFAASVQLPSETRVYVETKQDLIGKGDQVKEGQFVNAAIWRDVVVNGNVLIAAGTPVVAKVDTLKKRQIAGVKGEMSIGAYETESVDGQKIQLSGGYHKEGKSRMALSITLGVLFILPIFIPGKAAELPAGTIFDAYVDSNWNVDLGNASAVPKVDLSSIASNLSAELLYEKLEEQEKPEYFEFEITVPEGASTEFVIDRVNDKVISPVKLKNLSERNEGGELVVNAQVKIKTLLKQFAKGINTIEIASIEGSNRSAAKLIIDIQI